MTFGLHFVLVSVPLFQWVVPTNMEQLWIPPQLGKSENLYYEHLATQSLAAANVAYETIAFVEAGK